VYLIDFGLSKLYMDEKSGMHTHYRESKGMCGTNRYVSVNVHAGVEASRRDDLESVFYIALQFLKGKLPW
jgi:serine/threonine protein kinase